MPQAVAFLAPRRVALIEEEADPLGPGRVRMRTWYSGISAATELTAYRGSNPYLTGTWDADARLFRPGSPTFAYPVSGWGYSEVGEVVEVGQDVLGLEPGDVAYGIWGHRSEAVVPRHLVFGTLPADVDPVVGIFARVGAIALNAVLAADTRLGDRVAVFGQGVIGLLATRLAVLSGADVIAIDAIPRRLEVARAQGAAAVLDARVEGGAGAAVRGWAPGGVDAAIELSGNMAALHEATRAVVVDGTVVASGFYQGGAEQLRLGEEFHHNRVRIVASQISGTPLALGPRWNQRRLVATVMREIVGGRIDAPSLVTHMHDADDAAAAYAALDEGAPDVLQVVLRFDAAPDGAPDGPPGGAPGGAAESGR